MVPFCYRTLRECTDDVVCFCAFDTQERQPKRGDEAVNVADLLRQLLIHRRPSRLIIGRQLVAKGRRFGIKGNCHVRRVVAAHQF